MSATTTALKYLAITKVNYYHTNAYFFDRISLGFMVAVRLWVLAQLYNVTYGGATAIGGLTVPAAVWLLMFTNTFQLASGTRLMLLSIADEIKSGNIAYILGRPYSFLLYLFFSNVGRLIARIVPSLILGSAAALLLVGPISFDLPSVLSGLLLSVIGLSMNMIIIFCMALLAFWTEEVKPYRWIYEKAQWTLGGVIIPLALFPDSLRQIAEVLPFAATFYAPARMFVGYDPVLFWKFLGVQLFWLVVSVLTLIWLFKKGTKEISINGG